MNTNIIQFQFDDNTVRCDGLVSITALATAYSKATGIRCNISEWLVTKEATESIAYLASYSEIPHSNLVVVVRGGNASGTWVHSDLAEIFAQWISVEYRFAVVRLIRIAKEGVPKTPLELAREQVRLHEILEHQALIIASLEDDNQRQSEVIDELFDYSSIIRIAKYNSISETNFNWRVLKKICQNSKLEIKKAPCKTYGEKNLYPHEAWRLAYPHHKLPETTTLVINR